MLHSSVIVLQLLVEVAAMARKSSSTDIDWHAPSQTDTNNLTVAIHGNGAPNGIEVWCNSPHVRPAEYVRPAAEFKLQYVELIHRHHMRTPYASNAFPFEPDSWDCDDAPIYQFSQVIGGPEPAKVYRRGKLSSTDPIFPPQWSGTCAFPQITAKGLVDSWQHGVDLYDVYHGLVGLLPARSANYMSAVRYQATNNPITSQVAAMVISGMWQNTGPFPVIVQPQGVDSLEPQYSCRVASQSFDDIKSNNNPKWRQHLEASSSIFRRLDKLSRVSPDDAAFHSSFDHYFDNLSARQCHSKPLPCRTSHDHNEMGCVSQSLADAVYRLGHWEYSYIYRDHPASLTASAASFGVWIGELTTHLRDVMAGDTDVVYMHNVAHDGSISRLLSVLQLDEMTWPGMGSEVVFELYKRTAEPSRVSGLERDSVCHTWQDSPSPFHTLPTTLSAAQPSNPSCSVAKETSSSQCDGDFYVRVLFGGQPLRSSSSVLGVMDMVPVQRMLGYLDGLVGNGANLVKRGCQEDG